MPTNKKKQRERREKKKQRERREREERREKKKNREKVNDSESNKPNEEYTTHLDDTPKPHNPDLEKEKQKQRGYKYIGELLWFKILLFIIGGGFYTLFHHWLTNWLDLDPSTVPLFEIFLYMFWLFWIYVCFIEDYDY